MTDVATVHQPEQSLRKPPHEIVWELANGIVASRALHAVAELGVADHLGDEPMSAASLATACSADPGALDRTLRLLVACGVFAHEHGRYLHTEASRLLRSDHPHSMRAFARLNGLPVIDQSLARFDHCVRTGAPALELVDPQGLWNYLHDHPDEAAIFEEAMTAKAHADIAAVLDAYDFSPYRRIADIAGGRGHLIAAVLAHHEDADGVLFELPDVAAQVRPTPRLDVVAGDFFTDPLPACDAYLLMNIIHDWADPQATAILTAVACAGRPSGAAVLIVETVIPEDSEPHWAKTFDVLMLAVTGGRERTHAQYQHLLDTAGIDLVRTVPTATPFSIVEGRVR